MAPRWTMSLFVLFSLLCSSVLGAAAEPDFRDTCPEFQAGCSKKNECGACHASCVFCQNIGSETCDYEDCMTCLPGLHHIQVFNDSTGVCVAKHNLFKLTCPEHVPGCKPGNRCDRCHPSCKYCQGDFDHCGAKDCMQCQEGLIMYELFTDGTGECLPPGAHVERHELTCPQGSPGCLADNRCVECHPHCDTCQNLHSLTGICQVDDCLSCREGFDLVPLHEDGRGQCAPAGQPAGPAPQQSNPRHQAHANAGGPQANEQVHAQKASDTQPHAQLRDDSFQKPSEDQDTATSSLNIMIVGVVIFVAGVAVALGVSKALQQRREAKMQAFKEAK